MTARFVQRMPPFEGVAAGNTALIKLPIGNRFHHLFLKYAGVTLAQMTEIRVIANGKVFQKFSATERDTMNQFHGLAAANGYLQIPFDRLGLRIRQDEEMTAINTNVPDANQRAIRSFTIEIDIHADASAPALSMTAEQSPAVAGGPGLIMNIRKESRSIAGAGELEVGDYLYNTPVSQVLEKLFIKPSGSAVISKIGVERNLRNIWERETALNTIIQTDGVRTPQAGWYVIDGSERGYATAGISTLGAQDFRVKYEVSEAATINTIAEYIGVLGD